MVVIWKIHMPKPCSHQPASPKLALKQPKQLDRLEADKRARFTLVVGAGLSFLLLIGRGEGWHAVLASGCAWLKFGLVSGVLAYPFLGAALVFVRPATVP